MTIVRKYALKLYCGALLFFLLNLKIAFADIFIVRDIRVDGLQRISLGTVLNYLPVREGDQLDTADTGNLLRALYSTGFFQYIELGREGDVLVITVTEQPTIGRINMTGNKDIASDQLDEVLRQMRLVTGEVFQPGNLDQLKQELQQEYNNRGKYNARVTSTVTPLSQNRVAIDIDISEGRVAKIKDINLIGNDAFSDRTLLRQFSLSTPGLFTLLNQKDRYAQEKLDASLEAINSYYMDRGYIQFQVDSSQVQLSPDKKDVYIDVKIDEGPLYTFSGYRFTGDLILPEESLHRLVDIEAGDIYSHQKVTQAIEIIGEALGNRGYGFPVISAEPTMDEDNQQVFITFIIEPGRHIYVRRINFSGNNKTADYVLRRAMRQNEGSLISVQNIRESERQLSLLGYLEDINVETVPVPGTNNQVDLDVSVSEAPSAEAIASIGYGTNGPELNAAVNQYNFMGTGRTIGANFTTTRYSNSYSLSYYNPYYTTSGIGRGARVYYSTFRPEKLDLAAFSTDRLGAAVDYNMIISNTSSIQFGYGYEHLNIRSDGGITQIQAFTAAEGTKFDQIRLTGGWINNRYDRFPFPTRGLNQQILALIAVPAAKNALNYYKVNYLARYYYPLPYDFIFTTLASAGYGNQFNHNGLPFYENFYAGGIADPGQVRGYDSYSLGPRDNQNSPLGGNILVNGSAGLILPYPLSRETIRTTAFVDFGNVYSEGLPFAQRGNTGSGPLRTSAGLSLEWRSPFGPLAFSVASPLNKQPGDETQFFQFTLSSGF